MSTLRDRIIARQQERQRAIPVTFPSVMESPSPSLVSSVRATIVRGDVVFDPEHEPEPPRAVDPLAAALSELLRDESVDEAIREGVRLNVSTLLRLARKAAA